MQTFEPKRVSETLTRTYVLPAAMRAAGIRVTSVTSVNATVHASSPVDDPNAQDIINGAAQIVSTPITIKYQTVGAGQGVLQSITGGVVTCIYVITFTLVLSTGETFVEDTLQEIVEYVPADDNCGC